MDKAREDLLQTVVQRMMSVMRHVRHAAPPPEPVFSPPQLHLLFTMERRKEGISVKELAERASVTPGAVTQFIDPLVEMGLVSREGDPNDRRVVLLKLTDKAKRQFESFRKEHLASIFQIFEVLTDDDLRQLIKIFEKMATHPDMKENHLNA